VSVQAEVLGQDGGGRPKPQPEPKPAQTPNWADPAVRHKWYTSLRTQQIRSNSPAYVYQHRVLGTDIEREIVADDGTKVFADAITPDRGAPHPPGPAKNNRKQNNK